ncbi:MAG TPA: GWxTD domain-containing protein [Thermoanaerobaculia bacterium]|nr:GWxTD domain-containing protein [Thermoanaerobaculia bacterium]
MHKPNVVAVAVVSLFVSISAFAALSPEYRAWGSGPAKWIMTPQEARAWKSVKSDDEAIRFVDLFWARRDPTGGTPINEFRSEFEARAKYADEHFSEKNTPGSLTERGRFYIVLGPPTNLDSAGRYKASQNAGSLGVDATGGREMGSRQEWLWEGKDAQQYGMPKILAVFIEDPLLRTTHRVPQYSDVMGAVPVALRNQLVRPDLNELPDWAPKGGLHPTVLVTKEVATSAGLPVLRPAGGAAMPAEPLPPQIAPDALGATRFTLVKNVYDLVTETSTDPFNGLAPVAQFTRADELGWVARYCSPSDVQTLKVSMKITGMINGQKVNMNAPADEVSPDRVRATPGCYMVRGSVPLADVDPGTYDIVVTIEDAAGNSYPLTQSFVVE